MIAAPTLTAAEWRDVLTDKRAWLLSRVYLTPSPAAYWPRVLALAADEHFAPADWERPDAPGVTAFVEAARELVTADGLRLLGMLPTPDGLAVELVPVDQVAPPAQAAPPKPPTAAPAELGGAENPTKPAVMAQIAMPDTYTAFKVTAPGYSAQFSDHTRAVADFEKKARELEKGGDRFKVVLSGRAQGGKWEAVESRQQNER